MDKTPKALRLQIGIFGRMNVGKSSFLNMMSQQDFAITSSVPGTTTDIVEKTMELLPLGPVVFLDTAGLDDTSLLSSKRIQKTNKIFTRADIVMLIIEPNKWTDFEEEVCQQSQEHQQPLIVVINKIDQETPTQEFLNTVRQKTAQVVLCSSIQKEKSSEFISAVKEALMKAVPQEFKNPPTLIGDLLPSGGLAVLIVPIDLQAPQGRLILPQVQTIRDALDNDAAILVVKEREFRSALENLKRPPDIVVGDSQVVQKIVADTPLSIKCTTFSILFARYKGDLIEAVKGVMVIDKLKKGDKVLIAEACSHHALEDDIGRVKIPRWLRQYSGEDIIVDVCAGRDYPQNLAQYKLIVHCGGCMITRREMLNRTEEAKESDVPITNYGVCISFLQGVLERVLQPFPAALDAYYRYKIKKGNP